MDDRPLRRCDRQPDTVGYAVRHPDELQLHIADVEGAARLYPVHLDSGEKTVLGQPSPRQAECQRRGINWYVDFFQQIREAPDVIFVPVSQNQGANLVLVVGEIPQFGNDKVDTEKIVLGKHEAGVDDHYGSAIADGHHIHAKLAQSSEGHDFYLTIVWHGPFLKISLQYSIDFAGRGTREGVHKRVRAPERETVP